MRHYKRYEVWRLAHQLLLDTYALTETLPRVEQYGLAAQMKRAAVSVSSNIAEGAGRRTDRDFGRFLLIATGSANELEAQILAVLDLELASGVDTARLLGQFDRVRRHSIRLIYALG